MRWEHLFQTHILLRGMELFERCAVHHLQKKEDRIEAVVEGGRRYEVEIKYQQGEVTGLYCDCPHAEEGNHCKHMAAVFYAEQEAPEETYVVNGELADEEIAFIRARLQEESEETLRRLLFDLLVRNPRLARQYAMYHTKGLSEKEYARLNNQIVRIIDAYTDRNSYADYEDAWRLAVALCQFVEDEIQALIDAGHLREAINLIFSMVENYGATDIDDSAGGTQDLLERLSEASIQVLRGADIELKRSIFDAIIESHDGVDNDLLQAYLDELLFEEFLEREFLEKKKEITRKSLTDLMISQKANKGRFDFSYMLNPLAMRHLSILEALHVPEKEILQFYERYYSIIEIRIRYAKLLIKERNPQKAIEILNEGLKEDDSYRSKREIRKVLKEIYLGESDTENYRNILLQLLIEYHQIHIESYMELRKSYSEEAWKNSLPAILNGLKDYPNYGRLLEIEERYEELLSYVLQGGINLLENHEQALAARYPAEIIEKYRSVAEEMALNTGKRSHYRYLVYLLRKIKTYPQGEEIAQEIVEGWREKYRTRPAMMDELKKL